jgi:protein involved in polysaccharide export with SLBB domain
MIFRNSKRRHRSLSIPIWKRNVIFSANGGIKRCLNQLFLLLLLLTIAGCPSVPEPTFDARDPTGAAGSMVGAEFTRLEVPVELDPEWLKPNREPYRLGIGDVVEIEVTGVPGTRTETFIMPDGRLYFDLAGGVKADGLTIEALSMALREALKHDYANPQVNVTLREVRSRRVWVLGRVNKPGLYPLTQPTTLLEAVSMAGGLFTSRFSGTTEELADLGNSFILRDGEVLPVNFSALLRRGDMAQNIYLRDRDYIYLPSALTQNIHVLGAVVLPQALGFKDDLNLVAAIAAARGARPEADLSSVVIIRGSLSEPQVALVDVGAIMGGQASNVILRPYDIVWVPNRRFERGERALWTILNTAVRTIAVREGANAVETDLEQPPIVIPLN